MFIQTETTPNPLTLKFIPGEIVMESGTAEFRSPAEAVVSPFATRLFRLQGVTGVFYGRDFIAVTKDEARDWAVLKPLILGMVMDHFSQAEPTLFTAPPAAVTRVTTSDDPVTQKIIDLLEKRIRPAVAQDGGDITFVRFENGVVYVQMRGACAGCPSSTITLKAGIENMLRHYVPEVTEVRAA